MANEKYVEILKQGVVNWNKWRQSEPNFQIDLRGINLESENLMGVDFSGADLRGANLNGTQLQWSNLSNANLDGFETKLNGTCLMNSDITRSSLNNSDLRGVKINDARAWYAKFNGSNLQKSYLWGTDFREAEFIGADLSNANLMNTQLVQANFESANLTGCKVYGISAWDIKLNQNTTQLDLIITHPNEPTVLADDIEIAQFIHLILNNQKIRNAITTIGKKAVLILGRFTSERKPLLDAIKLELRNNKYLPILFDFENPQNRDLTETISTLAHLSRFIIADITDAKSIPQELQLIVPNLPSVVVHPIIKIATDEYAMFEHFKRYPWVLPLYEYKSIPSLVENIVTNLIMPAESKIKELTNSF